MHTDAPIEPIIWVTTQRAQYALKNADKEYAPLAKQVLDKMTLCEVILSTLKRNAITTPFRTIMDKVTKGQDNQYGEIAGRKWSEQDVLANAKFILRQTKNRFQHIDKSPFLMHLKKTAAETAHNKGKSAKQKETPKRNTRRSQQKRKRQASSQ